ncbi:MAG: YtxH domain-containing protein [Candidatus Humimicrobiaceae bacterium]
MKKCDVLGFILLAIGAGVTAGILLAPKSGKETRKDLSEKFEKVFEEACDFMTYESGRIKSKVSETMENLKDRFDEK